MSDQLPEGWVKTDLEDCVEILDSHRIPINANEREKRISGKEPSGLYPYYGATGQVGWIDGFLFDEEIVLLGEDGAPFLDADKDKAYLVRGKCWVNNHAHVLKARSGIAINLFLMHYLNYFDYQGYVTGTTRLKLNQGQMRRFPIPLPPLPEQERIVAKIEALFSQLDAGVAALRRIQAALKRYKASVLKAACEGRLVAQDPADEPAEALLRRLGKAPLVDDDLPALPEGWCWVRVGDAVLSMKNGIYKPAEFYSSEGVACLRMYNIEDGLVVWKDIKRMILTDDEIETYRLDPGDILINRVNSRELVGKAAVIPEGLEVIVFESKNIRLKINSEVTDSKFLNICYGAFSRQYFNFNAQQVVGMASINQTQIAQMPIPLPPLLEQYRIVAEVEQRLSVVAEVEAVISGLLARSARLRQAILKQAFSGQL